MSLLKNQSSSKILNIIEHRVSQNPRSAEIMVSEVSVTFVIVSLIVLQFFAEVVRVQCVFHIQRKGENFTI